MKKKILAVALVLVIALGIFGTPTLASGTVTANPTASTVSVDGTVVSFEAYTIDGSNYFKLRDLAYSLNGTAKQFEVGYNEATMAIALESNKAYTAAGGEMASGDGMAKDATPTPSKIYFDGRELNLTVYNIGGNNFFKLRDLMEVLDVFVGYDDQTMAITLDTSKGYFTEGSTTPTPTTQPSGGIDSRIVGQWNCYEQDSSYVYQFNEDGTFYSTRIWDTYLNAISGNYSTSNGTVYITDIVLQYSRGVDGIQEEPLKDRSSTYSFGFSEQYNKSYLEIRIFSRNDNNPDSELHYKFYAN
jgi:hypothetical protein